jgi:hypothetical protein
MNEELVQTSIISSCTENSVPDLWLLHANTPSFILRMIMCKMNYSFEQDVEMEVGRKVVIATISDTYHKDAIVQSVVQNRDRISC